MEDKLNTFFKNTDFDVDEPPFNHLERFEKRLNSVEKKSKFSYKWIKIVASIVLIAGLYIINQKDKTLTLADVSPEMRETESFFKVTISQEIKKIEKIETPKTKQVIKDALHQLKDLENNFKDLNIELNNTNKDKRVIHQMIRNYQNRTEILQNLLKQIERINNPKKNNNEKIYT